MNYPFIIQVLQGFLPGALPDLHLPRLRDVGLPVDDRPLAAAPGARRQRAKVQRLAVRGGALHGAEHAAELLPGPGGAVGAHAPEEGWHIPGGRHACSLWQVGGGEERQCAFLGVVRSCTDAPLSAASCILYFFFFFFSSALLDSHRLVAGFSKRRWSHSDKERRRERKKKKTPQRLTLHENTPTVRTREKCVREEDPLLSSTSSRYGFAYS